jgi:ribonuclease M5
MIGLIVEGKSDVKKIRMAIKEELLFVILNGVHFRQAERLKIKKALSECEKVFLLTDPDVSGDQVAEKIQHSFPEINRISIDPKKARVLKKRGYKYGVEYCSNRYLQNVLYASFPTCSSYEKR